MMKFKSEASKEAVLHAFSKENNRNAETLASYLKRYPEYNESIIDLSIELLTAPSFDKLSTESQSDEKSKKAWLTFQSMLNPDDPASAMSQNIANPLSEMNTLQFKELANDLNVTRLFLSRIRDNAVQVSTIPAQFIKLLAQHLKLPIETLQEILTAPPEIAAGQRFKASGKPSAGQKVTFDELLATSGLSESQQVMLKAMKD
ncbi:TPA: hypothetical protein I8412_002270 [Citrobacter freundii]|jgi:hypothetical protein|uniref:hypothetical protein n=1 Tax=Enterobacterales TaxID=91347 RepID=UPI0011A41115|nr:MULTISPECIES: hypothetical protein [Enterobacterales]EIQ9462806.1 hypothetical protein [Escherichia coli]MDE8796278.1 hypothetical protein [Citrobacter freundii]MDM3138810.1 hypothetical protein [Citrobacter sp. Cf120]MDM3286151.1 hypothetical protein [Citrobacter sp. Cf042]MDN4263140.1 hypothetical protein [Citrobacter freundii]